MFNIWFLFLLLSIYVEVHAAPAIVENKIVKLNQPKILIFYKTIPYFHENIPLGINAIQKLGEENGFHVDSTNIASYFTEENLKQYSAIIFLSTTGDILNNKEQKVFKNFYQKGKGFVGIHGAADTEYNWLWYNKLIGGHFASHPSQLQNATLNIIDQKFIATKHLPKQWKRFDEWYNFQMTHWDKVNILITINETTYYGGEHGQIHPMSWYQYYDCGRSFYTQLSHQKDSYFDPLFLQHLLGGIIFAINGTTT